MSECLKALCGSLLSGPEERKYPEVVYGMKLSKEIMSLKKAGLLTQL
jgi:hypothetical protein